MLSNLGDILEFFLLCIIVITFIWTLLTFSKTTNKTIKRLDELEAKLDRVMEKMNKER